MRASVQLMERHKHGGFLRGRSSDELKDRLNGLSNRRAGVDASQQLGGGLRRSALTDAVDSLDL